MSRALLNSIDAKLKLQSIVSNAEQVKLLLQDSALLDTPDAEQLTALYSAVQALHAETCAVLGTIKAARAAANVAKQPSKVYRFPLNLENA